MCVGSLEPCCWCDFHRSHWHLQGRAAALLRAESARKQVPHSSGKSHHTPQTNLHLLLGWDGKYLSSGAAETAALQRNLLQLFNRAPRALWPFCRYLEGSHLVSKRLTKSRWMMRLKIYYSIALKYRKGNSALSRGCTQDLFIKHIHQRCQLSNTLALGPQVHYQDLPKQASLSISVQTWLSTVESHGLCEPLPSASLKLSQVSLFPWNSRTLLLSIHSSK